ncbi:fumarylacetoacetate hydrolase family protein [Bacteroidota bacterium]
MKIICIGRNYVDHAKELNNPLPEKPIFFLKQDTCLITKNKPFFYPSFSTNIHHEVEIVLRINRLGKNIDESFAHRYFDEIGIGIDFTARDLQDEHRKKGLPWEISKAFDGSAPLSKFINKSKFQDVGNLNFSLLVNGNLVQKGNTSDLIFSFEKIIFYVSQFITLKIGDLLFTGTPAGVGPVKIGDRLQAFIEENLMLDFYVK